MIVLFTDFGAEGPYLGQMEAVLRLGATSRPVINLVSNAPPPQPAAYLLAALADGFPAGTIFLCVVDPGVGGDRLPVVLEADGRWYVGPDNGLLDVVAVQAREAAWRIIEWRPATLSASFHGRDLFAPVAARIAGGDFSWTSGITRGRRKVTLPADSAALVYFDVYGNAVTGWRYDPDLDGKTLVVNGKPVPQARTFCEVAEGEAFWYCNSMGLVEIAVNRRNAAQTLNLALGMTIGFEA